MNNQYTPLDELLYNLGKIKKEVIRTLGKYQASTLTITDADTLHNYISSCIEVGAVAVDTETNNSLDPLTCKLMGLCLYAPGLKAAYIPVNHRDPETKIKLSNQLLEVQIKEELQRLVDSGAKIIMHNGQFDYEVLKCTCDVVVAPDWDTKVAACLLDENESHKLKDQYASKIDKSQNSYSIETYFKKVQYADVQPEIFALYAATDSYMTYKLYEYQVPLMEAEKKIFNLFKTIEMPLIPIVAEMELCGAFADIHLRC